MHAYQMFILPPCNSHLNLSPARLESRYPLSVSPVQGATLHTSHDSLRTTQLPAYPAPARAQLLCPAHFPPSYSAYDDPGLTIWIWASGWCWWANRKGRGLRADADLQRVAEGWTLLLPSGTAGGRPAEVEHAWQVSRVMGGDLIRAGAVGVIVYRCSMG